MRRAEGCAAFFLRYFGGMQWEVWQLWIAAAMGLIILEVFVPGFVLACLGVGRWRAGAAALGWGLSAQLVSVALFSLLSFFFLRPVALRMSQSEGARTGVDALVGRKCHVTTAFDACHGPRPMQSGRRRLARPVGSPCPSGCSLERCLRVGGTRRQQHPHCSHSTPTP